MAHPPRIDLTIHFVRHGKTEMNRLGLLQGRGGKGLLPEGFADAERAARSRPVESTCSIPATKRRAAETARVIRDRLGLKPPIRFSPMLREMDYGTMSGRSEIAVRRLCPLWRRDAGSSSRRGELRARQARAFRWLDRILRLHPRETSPS
jgi:broad specificity phosphatase PhoE